MLLNSIKQQKLKDVRKPLFTYTNCIVDYNSNPQYFFFLLNFVMIFFKKLFLSILSFNIEMTENLAS